MSLGKEEGKKAALLRDLASNLMTPAGKSLEKKSSAGLLNSEYFLAAQQEPLVEAAEDILLMKC